LVKPKKLVTLFTEILVSKSFTMPLIILAALPTRNVGRIRAYGTSLWIFSTSRVRYGPSGERTMI
jgi:hypothetical protein